MGTEMVDIYVGPKNEHFHVHKAVLCTKIPYFEKMFNGGFSEASKNSATFPGDEPQAFDLLLGWVYRDSVERPLKIMCEASSNIFSFFRLAEKLCLEPLQDHIIDFLRKLHRSNNALPTHDQIERGYSMAAANSNPRKYLGRCFAFVLMEKDSIWTIKELSWVIVKDGDLAQDVLTWLRENSGQIVDPSRGADCDFHCHAKGEPCYKYVN